MHVWGKCCLVNIKTQSTHKCLRVAWWHLCAPRGKSITFQTADLHMAWLILQKAERQQTGGKSLSLGYSAVTGGAVNFASPNPMLAMSV